MFKEHKKLYKAGKNWLTTMLMVSAVVLFSGTEVQNVHADDMNTVNQAQVSQVQANQGQAQTNGVLSISQNQINDDQQTVKEDNVSGEQNKEDQSTSLTISQTKENDSNQWTGFNSNWLYTDLAASQSNSNQWTHFNDGWSYTDNNGNWVYNQWQNINNNWYYFNNNGYAQTGWYQSAGNWYYFDPTNAWALKGWRSLNGNWYYFDPTNAWALKGWQSLNGNWYYFDPTNSWMVTGWQNIDGKNYHFALSGAWDGQNDNNSQANTPGKWIHDYGNEWKYVKADGTQVSNEWLTINGKTYYFTGSGSMAVDGWETTYPTKEDYTIGRHSIRYYFDENGQIERNQWIHDYGNEWEYVKADGTQASNEWLTINGKTYYFTGSGSMAVDGWETTYPTKEDYTIGRHSVRYYFDENGQIERNQWIHDYGNEWEYVKADGTQANNEWLTINGKTYYFTGSGSMAVDGWETTYPTKEDYTIGSHSVRYYFDENGQIEHNQWIHDYGNEWEYVKADGTQASDEWLTINGKTYYFTGSGSMAVDGWETTYPTKEDYENGSNSVQYYFDENGQVVH